MGCVFSREVSSGVGNESSNEERREVTSYEKKSKSLYVESNDSLEVAGATVKVDDENNAVGINNAGEETKEEKVEGEVKPKGERKGERRRSKPNPRLGNPPKHKYGEQVAAGWPSWLSAHVGEAIDGWLPRRADTFEKIDKVVC